MEMQRVNNQVIALKHESKMKFTALSDGYKEYLKTSGT